jgi:hypothetical protein
MVYLAQETVRVPVRERREVFEGELGGGGQAQPVLEAVFAAEDASPPQRRRRLARARSPASASPAVRAL